MNPNTSVRAETVYSKMVDHAIYTNGLAKILSQIVERKKFTGGTAHYDWLFNHWYEDCILMAMEVLNEK